MYMYFSIHGRQATQIYNWSTVYSCFLFPRNLTKEEKKQLKEEEKRMKEQKRLDQQREKERKKREELITKNRQKTMKAFKVKHEMPN